MAYYGKLPIVLLSETASQKEDSYRCRLASYLLGRMGERVSVEEIARDCFVSKSAVSRFCREIGLEDFDELKELMEHADKTFQVIRQDAPSEERADVLIKEAASSLSEVASTLDYKALARLVRDIQKADRVACFGLLKAETAAINLQCDLTMLGKQALTKVSYREQMDFLSHSDTSDLILIFSYRGVFFEYDLPYEIKEGKGRIWVITGNPEAKAGLLRSPMIKDVLTFSSSLELNAHPYQLIAVSGIIAQETAAVKQEAPQTEEA